MTGMDQAALQYIAELGRKAHDVGIVDTGDHAVGDRILLRNGDATEWVPICEDSQIVHANTLCDFMDVVNRHCAADDEVIVAVDTNIVTARATRRTTPGKVVDYVHLRLPFSRRWEALLGIENIPFTPADAIKYLRFNLHGLHSEQLIGALRKVDFKRTTTGSSTTRHGQDFLGKSVESQVHSVEEIPEVFRCVVPVYNVQGCDGAASVDVGIFIDTANQVLRFIPLPDEIESAHRSSSAMIRDSISGSIVDSTDFLVICGSISK